MAENEILQARVTLEDEKSTRAVSVVTYEGALWLVPEWSVTLNQKERKPQRIIQLDDIPHRRLDNQGGFYQLVVDEIIPKAVLDGDISSTTERNYVVVDQPPLSFPIQSSNQGQDSEK